MSAIYNNNNNNKFYETGVNNIQLNCGSLTIK